MTGSSETVERAVQSFRLAYAEEPEIIVHAPGRVNLIGEHTDYNDGFVLPCAINYGTAVVLSGDSSPEIRAVASDCDGDTDRFEANGPFETQQAEWKNHVRAAVASIAERGEELAGARIAIAGNVPQGAGLSSSASLGVALAKVLAYQNGINDLDGSALALSAQRAENAYVGTACGIMDQLVSARGKSGHALLIDCRSLEVRPVAMPSTLAILVVHSGISRSLVDSAFNERRAQCREAAEALGVAALRDATLDMLGAAENRMSAEAFRRARHVISENERTLAAAEALAADDRQQLSWLMRESHRSMRDDFEITLPTIDHLVELADDYIAGDGGARMTGGGFGGCIVALVAVDRVDGLVEHIRTEFDPPDGEPLRLFRCQPSDGVRILD